MNAPRYQNDRAARIEPLDLDAVTAQFHELREKVCGGYRAIMIDVPWPYAARSPAGMEKSAAMHYACLSFDDIKRIPLHILAAENCAVFVWLTWPLMPFWWPSIEPWGFLYSGLAWEWLKYNKDTGCYAFGPGYGTRKNLEPCVLLTRGEPHLKGDLPLLGEFAGSPARSVRDFIEYWPGDALRERRREHSRKPDDGRARVETLFDGPYIDLFARDPRPGWTLWGNQTDKFA